VFREVTWSAMHKLDVEEWSVSAVMSLYQGAGSVVKTGSEECFRIKVGLRQVPELLLRLFSHE